MECARSRFLGPIFSVMFLVLIGSAVPAMAATYYVTKSGNDANLCMQALPCLTIARAQALATSPGDIVQVGAGTYSERITVTRSGSASGGKITFRGHDGSGCPTSTNTDIHAPAKRPNPNVTMQGFNVNASHIRIECFRITNTSSAGVQVAAGQTNVDVLQNYMAGQATMGSGVSVGSGLARATAVLVDNNYVEQTAYGFFAICNSCTFSNNEVNRLRGPSGDNDYSRIFGDTITFRGNYFHGTIFSEVQANDPHTDCFQTWNIGNSGESAINVTIDRNTCSAYHQGVILRDTTSSTPGSYSSHYNWTVTNNVFIHGQGGYTPTWQLLFEHAGNVVVENNTFVGGGPSGCAVVGYLMGTRGVHRNNIHVNCGFLPYSNAVSGWSVNGQLTASSNLLYEPGRTYSGFALDLLNQNPNFVNPGAFDYHLQSSSPARDTGTQVSVTFDRDGKQRPIGAGIDRGAYEFGTGTGTSDATPGAPAGLVLQ
jgi:hypothetical protein